MIPVLLDLFENIPIIKRLVAVQPEYTEIATNSHDAVVWIASPLWTNILASFAMVVYYKFAIELACFVRTKNWTGEQPKRIENISRNVLHLFFSSVIIFWPYFDQSCWSWKLAALLPAVILSRLIYKGVVVGDPSDADVLNLSLSGSPSALLLGPFLLAGVFFWLTLYQFMTEEAAIISAMCFGDGLAPLVGSLCGRHFFNVPFGRVKTIEGSVCVFLGTVIACYFNLYILGIPLLPLRIILAYGGIAAVAEGTSPANLDNLITPIVLHFSIERVKELLPP